MDFASWQEEAPIEEEVLVEEDGQVEDVHVEEAQMPRGRKTTALQLSRDKKVRGRARVELLTLS